MCAMKLARGLVISLKQATDTVRQIRYMKILISFYQVTASFLVNFGVEWPELLASVLNYMSFFSLDFFNFPGIACVMRDLSYNVKHQIFTLAPIAVVIFLAVPSAVLAALIRMGRLKAEPKLVHETFSAFLFFTLYVTCMSLCPCLCALQSRLGVLSASSTSISASQCLLFLRRNSSPCVRVLAHPCRSFLFLIYPAVSATVLVRSNDPCPVLILIGTATLGVVFDTIELP